MRVVKYCAIIAFLLTISISAYFLIDYFTNIYFLIALAFLVILVITVKLITNGRSNNFFPELTGKVIIVTGANTGLGYESCK